jgi:protein-S-isoprenylcysteine O-methyltransferase Ste14
MTLPLPFSWPYALLFWSVYVWMYIPEFRIIRAAREESHRAEDRSSLRVLMAGFALALLAAFAIPFLVPRAALPGDPRIWFFAGVATLILGSLLRRHCFRVLGAFFTGIVKIQDNHRVIDVGAYRWVRHPSYTAALVIVLGVALAFGNWLGIAVALALAFPAYFYRAYVEEQAMLAALGEPYARFMATRRRFVPFIL